MLKNTPLLFQSFMRNQSRDCNQNKSLNQQLQQMMLHTQPEPWLTSLVTICGQFDLQSIVPVQLFMGWELSQLHNGLDSFSNLSIIDMINTIFFYKLYPEKIAETDSIPFEKLVSIRQRLETLHHFIELIQYQLCNKALEVGLSVGTDYLYHGENIPTSITITPNAVHKQLILRLIKKIPFISILTSETNPIRSRLAALIDVYKYSFSPNLFIDAILVLERLVLKQKQKDRLHAVIFKQELSTHLMHFSTMDCVNLYGYLANKDSQELIYHLNDAILHAKSPHVTHTLTHLCQAIQGIREAVRDVLHQRQIETEPYSCHVNLPTNLEYTEVIERVLSVYSFEKRKNNEYLEALFMSLEEDMK